MGSPFLVNLPDGWLIFGVNERIIDNAFIDAAQETIQRGLFHGIDRGWLWSVSCRMPKSEAPGALRFNH